MADEDAVLAVRRKVGSGGPTDEDIEETLDRLDGNVEKATYEFLEMRLAELRANPTRLTIDGDRTEDWSGNIAALERAVAEAAVNAGSSSSLTVTRLVRPSRER